MFLNLTANESTGKPLTPFQRDVHRITSNDKKKKKLKKKMTVATVKVIEVVMVVGIVVM